MANKVRRDAVTRANEFLEKVANINFTQEETEDILIKLDEVKKTLYNRIREEEFNKELEALYKKYKKKMPK